MATQLALGPYSKWFAIIGLGMVILNTLIAWFVFFSVKDQMARPIHDDLSKIVAGAGSGVAENMDVPGNRTGLAYMAMSVTMRDKSIGQRYLSNLISIGMAFSLIAFGVTLFVLCFESAYQLGINAPAAAAAAAAAAQAGAGAGGGGGNAPAPVPAPSGWNLTLMASSPGLACFVLAAALIIATVVRSYDYQLEAPTIAFHDNPNGAAVAERPAVAVPIPPDKAADTMDKDVNSIKARGK